MSAVSRRENNLSADDISEIGDFANSDHFDPTERAVLQYATEMTHTPVVICDENFEQLKAKFNSKQLVELTSTIAFENFRARYNHAFGIGSAEFDAPTS